MHQGNECQGNQTTVVAQNQHLPVLTCAHKSLINTILRL